MLWIHYIPDLNPGWEAFCKDSWSLIICLIFVNSGCIVSLIFFAKYLPILKLPNLTNGRGKIKYSCVYLLTNLVLAPKWPIISGQLGNHTQGPCFTLLGKKLCYPNLSQSIFDFHGFLHLHHTVLKSCLYKIYVLDTCVMQGLRVGPRYSTRDHWKQESWKGQFNSGLFGAISAAEKKNPICHYKYATFDVKLS